MSGFKLSVAVALATSAVIASAWVGHELVQSSARQTDAPASASRTPASIAASHAVAERALAKIAVLTGQRLVKMSPDFARDMQILNVSAPYGAIVHFDSGTPAQHRELMSALKLEVGYDFEENAQALYVQGTVAAFQPLLRNAAVRYLEANSAMRYYDDTDAWATHVRVAQEPVSGGPYYDADGNVLRGQGIGIAVVDSGFNGPHPDLANRIARNYRVNCPVPLADEANIATCVFTDLGNLASSEVGGGHGTHCAGIALGDGSYSSGVYPDEAKPNILGTYTGVAPGASLYGFGAGAATQILLLNAAAGFDKIIKDNESGANDPKVRVVSNSYGGDGPYDPEAVVSKLTNRAIEKGIVVVFAAGNDGEDFTADAADPSLTGASCRNPTPGLICVASYNDNGTGARDAALSGFSSRADPSRLSEYPDIAAPGDLITAVCAQGDPGQAICTTGAETHWQPYYGTISGTSMATPHVAGIVALMLQARPDLTPPEVEKIIKDHALKLSSNGAYVDDPSNPGGTTNNGFGAGLIDLPSILDSLGVRHGPPSEAGEQTIIAGDADPLVDGAADITKLTMQEVAQGGVPGMLYRVTVRDATAFGASASYVRLIVRANVNGNPRSTSVKLTKTGLPTADSAGATTTSPATNVALEGNVVSFFVPLASLGAPPVGVPVHNIRASSSTDSAGMETVVDYAPGNSANATLDNLNPVYGKPYTILNASTVIAENRCLLPGLTMATDVGGDALTMTSSFDMLSVGVTQAYAEDGAPLLNFQLKAADLNNLTPGSAYFASFVAPDGTTYGVRMVVASPTAPTFISYVAGPSGGTPPVTDGRFIDTSKPAETGSGYDAASGTITILVKPADVGLTTPGQKLTGFNGGSIQNANPTGVGVNAAEVVDEMPNGLSRSNAFEFKANLFCAPNALPLAVISVDKITAARGQTFNFSGLASTDADAGDTIASYVFDFGDQTAKLSSSTPTASHVYGHSGNYSVSLTVTDSKGGQSLPMPKSSLGVGVSNTAPGAVLASDRSSGAAPLTVNFDASASSDADGNDHIVSYSFDLDGDGVYEIKDSTSPKASKTYDSNGTRSAAVKVRDSESLESAVVTQSIAVGGNGTPPVASPGTPTTPSVSGSGEGRFGGGLPLPLLALLMAGAVWRRGGLRRR